MSHDPSPRSGETTLSETLEQRLRSYSIAAAAAGVGMLALAHPAEAEVVITHKVIPVNGTAVSIDINTTVPLIFNSRLFSAQWWPAQQQRRSIPDCQTPGKWRGSWRPESYFPRLLCGRPKTGCEDRTFYALRL